MKFKKYALLIIFILIFFTMGAINICYGQTQILPTPTGDRINCPDNTNCGNYKLDDFVTIAIRVSEYILGISGSLALLFFIYGGIMFLISGGQSEKINSAKQIITNSLIGLVLIFASYAIIGFVITKVFNIQGDWFRAGGLFK